MLVDEYDKPLPDNIEYPEKVGMVFDQTARNLVQFDYV
jgi:hypothetical protein